MTAFAWIVLGGVAMTAITLVGTVTLLFSDSTFKKLMLPLVAFAAGAMIGGAFFHMLPAALLTMPALKVFVWTSVGFTLFFVMEQLLHWHHCRRATADVRKPVTYLVLIGDGLHNLIGGMAVAGVFLVDIRLGIAAWLAAALHEIPQELGDFAVLVNGGWKKSSALVFNLLSGVTFLIGGLIAYGASSQFEIQWLVPFAAGNFLYIGAADLVPEVNKPRSLGASVVQLGLFLVGLTLLFFIAT